ncbi:MAG: ABC transporter ATP-binding protein [Leptolyngbyaceae cyanobacterium RU_5_1]|nr:ABC transporter ATP-binding protein [Leptolyngbyaceae cyanobacterium RU_5_1]
MGQFEILRLQGVTRQFPQMPHPAVNQITVTLQQGDLLGLLGSSGCGKTTLLRLIAGFEQPQAGTVELNGQVVAGAGAWVPPERRDIGMVFQDYALFPHLTVAKNVRFGLTHQGRKSTKRYTPQRIQELCAEAIARVGLKGLENRYPHQLSGGQQQRVALARALAPQPALILLDEPLSNLDLQVRLKLRQEVRDILKATNTSAIFVTHDQEEALSISDWVAVMRQGQIEQLGTPEAIYQEPASRFIAEFVTQANFLPATFDGEIWRTEIGCFKVKSGERGRGGKWEVSTIQNSKFKIQNSKLFTPHSSPLTPHSTADLMVRQEDIQIEPDQTASVVVRDRQFLGRDHRYSLLIPSGQELQARVTNKQIFPAGTRVKLSIANSALKVFPKDLEPNQ